MNLARINPKNLFRSKKDKSLARLNSKSSVSISPSSSCSSLDQASTNLKDSITPKSVLPSKSKEISNDWSDFSSDTHYELVQAFKFIDKDGDGRITKHELETVLSRLGSDPPSEEELRMMLMEVDLNGDGCIDLEAFGIISSAFAPACGSELRGAFDFFDADRDGKISAEELLEVFKAIGDDQSTLEDCRRMIEGVDLNGDGFVCFEDFSHMMEQERF